MKSPVQLLRFRRSSWSLHPAVLTALIWSIVGFAYSLHYSEWLIFDTRRCLKMIAAIVIPSVTISLAFHLYKISSRKRRWTKLIVRPEVSLDRLEYRIRQCTRIWIMAAIAETTISGGIPLEWLLLGIPKSNFEYGIPSVHGMVNALLLAIALGRFGLYAYTGKKRHLWLPLFAIFWSFAIVSRGTLFVLVLEYAIVYLRIRKLGKRTVALILVGCCILILIFGVVGDLRSGAEAFKAVAMPTPDFPSWLPSGVLWTYVYMATPINNLLYTQQFIRPSYNPLWPNTAATLFPSFIRKLVYGETGASDAISGELLSNALNVSTGYIGPLQDFGLLGVCLFSAFSSLLCQIYWHRNGFRNIFLFAVFAQALVLSLLYNLLLSLPILGQIPWFYYFTRLPKQTSLGSERPHSSVPESCNDPSI